MQSTLVTLIEDLSDRKCYYQTILFSVKCIMPGTEGFIFMS